MGVVTVSAAYGAAGADVSRAVAQQLGVPFHDRAITAQVAVRLGVSVSEAEANDETVVRGLWRLVASLGTMPDPVGGVLPTTNLPDARAYRQQTERILREIADGDGGVVLGRAGALVLKDRPDALHVRLDGPRDQRLEAAIARSGRSPDAVREEMEANDRSREAYVRHFYRCDPSDAQLYHLVIDTTAIPLETVIELVMTAARGRGMSGS